MFPLNIGMLGADFSPAVEKNVRGWVKGVPVALRHRTAHGSGSSLQEVAPTQDIRRCLCMIGVVPILTGSYAVAC